MRLPSVEESREIFSPSAAPEWLNMSSNAASRVASISFTASPPAAMTSARCSARSRNESVTLLPRETISSVMRLPVCSSFVTTSPPRRLRSRMSDSPDAFSVLLTSSARVAIVSARRLDVSMMFSVRSCARVVKLSVSSCERPTHHVEDRQRFFREAFGDAIEPRRHHVFQAAGDFGELLGDVVGLEIEAAGELFAGCGDRARGLLACGLQALDQIAAAVAQLLHHVVADASERQRDVLALLGERLGDALRRLADLLADEIADRGQVLRQIDVDVADGGAHLLGLGDESVALVDEILDQPADADLVVAVGAFERGDFVLHQRFEFARARERALDAVAHGRDLAAYRLTDAHDRVVRHGLRLGEPHGDVGHRLCDQAQFLRAPGHVGHAEEEDDRQQRAGAEADHDGYGRMAGSERRAEVRQIGPGERNAADHPGDGEDGSNDVGRMRRATLQRLQHLADRALIVVGGGAGRAPPCAGRTARGHTARRIRAPPAPRGACPARAEAAAHRGRPNGCPARPDCL